MPKNIWRKLLRVNLSNGKLKEESIPEKLFEKYIGGSGLATKYLYDEVPARTNALDPKNKIIFATGPFQGTKIIGSAKFAIVSRSPLTGTFGVTTAGAEFGTRMKKAGYDLIIIEGKSKIPLYLWINDGKAELKSAKRIWGKDAIETVDMIKKDLEELKISVASIGPAGEKKVAIACIVVDSHSFAGRCGFGAVLGSKGLKAIAVKGTKHVSVAEEVKLKELNKKWFKNIAKTAKETYKAHGTANDIVFCENAGDLPIKYWSQSAWPEGAKKIGAPNYTEVLKSKSWPCLYCPIGCHRHIKFEYRDKIIEGAGPEYESLGMLGSNCLVDDLMLISKANDLCNRLGIDTVSAGSYVGFTMECFEKGLITTQDLKGKKAHWGDGDFLIDLIGKIGNKEGFGAIFSEGIRQAATTIGNGAEELIVEVKNLDFPAHDPRTYYSLAINYATGTRGACHTRGYPHVSEIGGMTIPEVGFTEVPERFHMEGQARLTALFQGLAAIHDSLVLCIFSPILGLSLTDTVKFLNSATGWELTPEGIMKIGERIFTLQRQINIEDGLSRKDDMLPQKMFNPGDKGIRKGKIPEPFEKTLLEYYRYRGWDSDGKPTAETLKELGLTE